MYCRCVMKTLVNGTVIGHVSCNQLLKTDTLILVIELTRLRLSTDISQLPPIAQIASLPPNSYHSNPFNLSDSQVLYFSPIDPIFQYRQ